jgi:2-polyprenyl-3-methyl-5-hydroxy-6-metoxy-1,4-benzoquinol methylase
MKKNSMDRAGILTESTGLVDSVETEKTRSLNAYPYDYKKFLSKIVDAYDSTVIRAYSKARFTIININILQMLGLCLRGKRRILDVGCGFGLFGCYFSAMYPEITYCGYDLNQQRINTARRAAAKLGLQNVSFHCSDARELKIDDEYDAVMMVDLLHHIDNDAKHNLLEICASHLADDGRLIIKDVTTHPFPKIAFTWALDVLMTRGFEMWYWNEKRFYQELSQHFNRVEMYPIVDWLPYPHVIYLCENAPFANDDLRRSSVQSK